MALLSVRVVVTACLAVALHAGPAGAQPQPAAEEDVKAAFLYNFAKYVEWPASAFRGDELRICVVADRPFLASVDAIIAGETIEGRPVTRQTPTTPEAARGCHVLFVRHAESARAAALLAAVQGMSVLTVGETPDFVEQGGMIALVRDGDRVRFDVDIAASQRAGLIISSRLLRLARRVRPSETER